MPEEINRVLTDAISDLLFVHLSRRGDENLRREGVADGRIHFVGNVMIDTLLANLDRARERATASGRARPRRRRYGVVDAAPAVQRRRRETLEALVDAMRAVEGDLPMVFPSTRAPAARLDGLRPSTLADGRSPVEPLGYLDFLGLIGRRGLVLTDSGGIQEETTMLGVPCLTLRENTERPVTSSGHQPARRHRPGRDRCSERSAS